MNPVFQTLSIRTNIAAKNTSVCQSIRRTICQRRRLPASIGRQAASAEMREIAAHFHRASDHEHAEQEEEHVGVEFDIRSASSYIV
jgi:hypothetical protein